MSTSGSAAKSLVVLTVDDHPLIRSALRELIGLMAERVELLEAANPPDGLAMLERRADTDLVLLDLNFAAHDGLAFIERFRAAAPATPVLVYTMHEDAATLRQALALGAVGIVPKTHSAKLLQKAIELVMDGGIYLPPELARQLASPEAAPAARPASRAMSEQQWKILELLAQGFPNKAIARELGIAPSTVKNQLTVVFDKLGVSNRTQAAIAARALIKSKPPGH
jgi:DNA-binding NarL/FixJ family response regulator